MYAAIENPLRLASLASHVAQRLRAYFLNLLNQSAI
jgi:hypothetical protein